MSIPVNHLNSLSVPSVNFKSPNPNNLSKVLLGIKLVNKKKTINKIRVTKKYLNITFIIDLLLGFQKKAITRNWIKSNTMPDLDPHLKIEIAHKEKYIIFIIFENPTLEKTANKHNPLPIPISATWLFGSNSTPSKDTTYLVPFAIVSKAKKEIIANEILTYLKRLNIILTYELEYPNEDVKTKRIMDKETVKI